MDRKLTTIMVVDLCGFTRLTARDEEGTIARLRALRADLIDPVVADCGGRIVKSLGDGILAEFTSPVAAARCALTVQDQVGEREVDQTDDDRFSLRVGLHLGDIVIEGDDILGDAVNLAKRVEGLAEPGGICVTRAVRDQISGKIPARTVPMGAQRIRNLPDPVEIWKLEPAGTAQPARATATAQLGQPPTLAVLPFSELGPDTGDFLADGVVEEITAALSQVRSFVVIARQSAFALGNEIGDVRDVGRKLGARYIVTGSVRRSGDRLRVMVQLSDAKSGAQLTSARYDDRLADLFALEDRIASQVAGAISPSVLSSEIAAARALPPADRDAYGLVMSAYPHFWTHSSHENDRAIELLSLALERNPNEMRARALRAWAYAQRACYMWSNEPLESRTAALADADAAVVAAGDHAPSLVAISAAISMTSLEVDRAERILDRAQGLNPNSAWGWMRKGWISIYRGQPKEAIEQFDRAELLSPRDPFLFNMDFGRGFACGLLEDFDQGAHWFNRGLSAGPAASWVYRDLASLHARAGRKAEAEAALESLRGAYPDLTIKRIENSMPPAVFDRHTGFFDGLRSAGIPEG
ncbi:adenylate/guanylate cyclase [Cribrihabitans marinus]|uniref:Adenylate/guanylate cyclase n=1 Tax=Cribrihabitans marinus TaxID=1227549 RepID=A0A1H6STR1_9RHOB|nr:adenylate/guanylate cyclase domain-containing protein [Cribrihabitans marinus]GGH22854.1 adenylate cyclase [Cribrihabitans marinus]SEI71313.1 adenylate/guanylate cyclase [Cribrihabitans marinus]